MSDTVTKVINGIQTKVEKIVQAIGVNGVAKESIGNTIVGVVSALQTENAGGWMNPNVVDGYSYNPADGKWYESNFEPGTIIDPAYVCPTS